MEYKHSNPDPMRLYMYLCTVGHDTLVWDDQIYLYRLIIFAAAVMTAL